MPIDRILSVKNARAWFSMDFTYSHLSNKREVTLTNFEKFPPPQKKNLPSTFIVSINIFNLHVYSSLHVSDQNPFPPSSFKYVPIKSKT